MTLHAPVSISVYDRVSHLRECIAALQKNPEAAKTVLYIFSDAARPGDEGKVNRVREYTQLIRGFAEIRLIFQASNSYVHNNKQSREIPLKDFGRVIRMEDDICVSKNFLKYMNEGLDIFRNDKKVFSINAYLPKMGNVTRNDGIFLSKDFNSWGYATWKDRNISEVINNKYFYDDILKKTEIIDRINQLHPYLIPLLRLIKQDKLNANDIKITAYQFLTDSYSVKPFSSLVKNIGFDGSGVGNTITSKFDIDNFDAQPLISRDIEYQNWMDTKLYDSYFDIGLVRAINKLKYQMLGLVPKSVYSQLIYLNKKLK
jgi:hypothetical protein